MMGAPRDALQRHLQERGPSWCWIKVLDEQGCHDRRLADHRAKEVLPFAVAQGAKVDRALLALDGVGEATADGLLARPQLRRDARAGP